MKSFLGIQAFLLILYLIEINGRHLDHNEYDDLSEAEEQTELLNRMKNHASQTRHRRRSRQMYGYDYPQPYYYDNRRDYNYRQQEDYLSQIVKSLEEIIGYLRTPPPRPQPVYIPYPVVQYIPCRSRPGADPKPITTETSTQIPSVTERFPVIEDDNQLWGSPIEEIPVDITDVDDGSRPISFDPVPPSRPTKRPPPPVDHGSNQAGMEQTTAAPVRRPGVCETAILTCCSLEGKTAQKNCFTRYNCTKTYSTNRACDPSVIKRVLENFSNAYAPVKNN